MKSKTTPVSVKSKTSTKTTGVRKTAKTPVQDHELPTASAASTSASEILSKPKRAIKKTLEGVVGAARSLLKPKRAVKAKAPVESKPAVIAETATKEHPPRPRKKVETHHSAPIPSILMEGDTTPVTESGPGRKYSLGTTPPAQHFDTAEAELPESYGTKKLFLTARDPHWLYAHWDLTREQQLKLNAQSSDGHLILRIYEGRIEGHPKSEIHVHPESRHWFAHVENAGKSYAVELGYYSSVGKWTRVAVSSATVTPPDAISSETDTEYATIPFEFPFAKLMRIIEQAVCENLPLAQAIEELRRHGHPDLPKINGSPIVTWTPEQEKALAGIISIDETRRVWMGSLEITELIRRRLAHAVSSIESSFGISSPGISSVTSPFGGMEKQKGFWFNVNAELIIYGATEPDAKVTLGGHEIKLRSDGSFSYRFALPDGDYDLPAVAVSADRTDARAADLHFSRQTVYLGDVGTHPQDPSLKTPTPENIL